MFLSPKKKKVTCYYSLIYIYIYRITYSLSKKKKLLPNSLFRFFLSFCENPVSEFTMQPENSGLHICRLCASTFITSEEMNAHKNLMHSFCVHCDRREFNCSNDLQSHNGFTHKKFKHICSSCKNAFQTQADLQQHFNEEHSK